MKQSDQALRKPMDIIAIIECYSNLEICTIKAGRLSQVSVYDTVTLFIDKR